jgi:uncharacterized protein YeeX (DUF496 family)
VDSLRTNQKDEISDLKRKLADNEKRVMALWEHFKNSDRKTDDKVADF